MMPKQEKHRRYTRQDEEYADLVHATPSGLPEAKASRI
jgi:hypothetical protein